ncbi:MAG: AAA family ATPase [Bacteroidota bacterium]
MFPATGDPLRICVIGPESTGKSSLAEFLAEQFNTVWVPEFARQYIEQLDRPYEQHDLLEIAHGQVNLEEERLSRASEVLIMDTNLLVLKVWSEHKYGDVHQEIMRLHNSRRYDLYLLTDIDLPWAEDPQREHPHLRTHFMSVYRELIESTGIPFRVVSGIGTERNTAALNAINSFSLRA